MVIIAKIEMDVITSRTAGDSNRPFRLRAILILCIRPIWGILTDGCHNNVRVTDYELSRAIVKRNVTNSILMSVYMGLLDL